jgi:DNA-binding XRE family transcriptional regulator
MDDVLKRIHLIMNHYELSASAFADKIKVQRSSISHILNGRNKPSLEFVMKVIEHFSTVDFYWLVYGKGAFPKTATMENKASPTMPSLGPRTADTAMVAKPNAIEQIVVFYADGTFKTYQPQEGK